jgi:hypothetical protein
MLEQIVAAIEAGDGKVENLAQTMMVSENTFLQPHNTLAAVHVDMNHNLFSTSSQSFLAACFAESGIYVGNRGPGRGNRISTSQIPSARAEAANLNVEIVH